MTYTSSIQTVRTPVLPLAVGTTMASFASNALGIYGDGKTSAEHSTSEFLVVCGIAVVAALVVFGVVLPRTMGKASAGRTALILSVLAVLSVAVFWAGITPALGVGAIALGLSSDHRASSRIGIAVGALAMMAYVATYISDWLSTNGYL